MRETLRATTTWLDAGFDTERDAKSSRAEFLAPGAFASGHEPSPEPLAEALAPLCSSCWTALHRQLGSPPRLLSEQAALDLQDALREDLARLLAPALSVETALERAAGDDPTLSPDSFAKATLGSREGLADLFATYPVLERLCETVTDRWVDGVRNLLTRLVADREAIGALVGESFEQPLVTGVSWGERPAVLGRPELLLHFAGDRRIHYVPRPLPSHAAFVRLVDWLNDRGLPHELRTSRLVDRTSYGWVEHVDPQPCRDAEDVARFYRRAGAWTFLTWLLRATDLSNEDFVARGSHPVFTRPRLLQHRLVSTPVGLLGHSVLSTGMIGSWRLLQRKFWDVSALPLGKRSGRCRVTASWGRADDDLLRVQFRMAPEGVTHHLPYLETRCEPVTAHTAELVRGFRDTFSWFTKNRERLLREDSPLTELLDTPVDVAAYDQPGARLRSFRFTAPSLLGDETEHRGAAEAASSRFLKGICDDLAATSPLLAADARATADLALPSLTAHPGETVVRIEEEDGTSTDLPGLLEAPSAQDVRDRIRGLDATACEEQVRLLRIVIDPPSRVAEVPTEDPEDGSQSGWLEEALRLADDMVGRAARTASGAPTWLTVTERPSRGLSQMTPLPPEGIPSQGGIALFLAAAARAADRPDLRQHAFRALDPIRTQWAGDRSYAFDLPNGAVFGVGSLIYTLTLFGRLAEDDGPVDDALGLARRVTSERIRRDSAFDVYAGNAGLILALAALYDHTREAWIEPLLTELGEHLLAHRVPADENHRAWSSSNEKTPLGGFSHGVAGISYALVRAFEITGHRPLLEGAREAVAYEHGLFAPEPGQWRDLRMPGSFMCSWCHGAPGIALARASILDTLDDDVVRTDLERAVQATLDGPVEDLDHLCCGNFGRVECLWVAAHRSENAPLRAQVSALASQAQAKARARGRYAVDWPGTRDSPTFLRGLSGIGYQCLRLADPNLPSVLALA